MRNKSKKETVKTILRVALLVLCFGACMAGALSNEINLVLAKASAICLECIGIG